MPKRHLVLSVLLAAMVCGLSVCRVRAQQMRMHPLPTQPLLPVAQVHAIAQTADGMMWYATTDGLCRDNGYQVDVFRPGQNDGGVMRSPNIYCLLATKDYLFFGTGEGLYRLDPASLRIARLRLGRDSQQGGKPHAGQPEPGMAVRSLLPLRDGTIAVSVGTSLACLAKDLTLTATLTDNKSIIPLCEDSHGRVWLNSNDKLVYTRAFAGGGTKRLSPMSRWGYAAPVAMCPADGKDKYWVATYGDGILLLDVATQTLVRQEASVADASDSRVIDMHRDGTSGLLWVSTMSGLDTYRTTGGRLERVDAVGNLPSRKLIVDHLCEDRDGQVWVSGFSPTTFIVAPDMGSVWRTDAASIRQATGFCLLADRMVAAGDGYYWVWQGRYGLALYHGQQGVSFICDTKPQGLASVEREFVGCASQPGIMAYNGNTVWRLWHEGMTVRAERVASVAGGIRGIRTDAQGRLWIATRTSIYLYMPASGVVRTLYTGRVSLLGSVAQGGNACLFASGQALLSVGCDGKVARVADVGEDMTCIVAGSDGAAWAATKRGRVLRCQDGGAEARPELGEPSGNIIKQVSFDDTGCLWTLTDQAVTRHNLRDNTFARFAAGDADIRVDYFYGLEPEGRGMGVTGAGAYCVLPTAAMSYAAMSKAVAMVSSVSTPDTTVLLGAGQHTVEIPPGTASVSVSLSSGEHLHAAKVSFAWRYGTDGSWTVIDKGGNRAFLGRLQRGDYDIYVKATDRYGNWGEPRLCVTLHRLPAWWETWWAWTLYILAAIAAAAGIAWLASRIWYLRRLQHLRQEMSLSVVSLEPDDVSARRYDTEFTRSMLKAIEGHISDPAYNVQGLAADMHTSRANLFRKCKALTGKNPTNLIKEIRLKAAATMLASETEASVADIAEKTGFASASYFTKCFKEMFGILPNQYRARNNGGGQDEP